MIKSDNQDNAFTEQYHESPMLALTDLMIGIIFLLLIVISTLSLTYRGQIKQDERVVDSEDSLLQSLQLIRDKLSQSNYREQRLAEDLLKLENQTKVMQDNNKELKQQQLVLRQKLEKVSNSRLVPQKLLQEMEQQFKQQKIPAVIDRQNGIIHFADSLLFTTGNANLTKKGKRILHQLAQIFSSVLPCFSQNKVPPECARAGQKQIEAIFIEGHTDNVPYVSSTYDNWQLSMRRARETYKQLIATAPQLNQLKNSNSQPIFSLSAYGETRPIASNQSREGRRKNRRIDIRLISVGYTLESLMDNP